MSAEDKLVAELLGGPNADALFIRRIRNEAASAISRLSAEVQELRGALPSAETLAMIEQMVAGTAPLSKWVASVDYSTYDGFEQYLAAQLESAAQLDNLGGEINGRHGGHTGLATDGRQSGVDCGEITP